MKLLLLEDEPQFANLMKTRLEREGYKLDCIADGLEGQKHIERHYDDYELVLLDLMLPGESGYEICTNVRTKGITIPIIVLTGKDSVDDKVAALDGGADDYLVKPFEFKELLSRIKTLLRRPRERLTIELRNGDIVLNSSSQRVHLGGHELKLTHKEFRILEYVMRFPNKVITRDEILSNVWKIHFDSFSNLVDVHITHLRKKLNTPERGNFLETVRGVGYRLNAASAEHVETV